MPLEPAQGNCSGVSLLERGVLFFLVAPPAKISIPVVMKQWNATSAVPTIASRRTLRLGRAMTGANLTELHPLRGQGCGTKSHHPAQVLQHRHTRIRTSESPQRLK